MLLLLEILDNHRVSEPYFYTYNNILPTIGIYFGKVVDPLMDTVAEAGGVG